MDLRPDTQGETPEMIRFYRKGLNFIESGRTGCPGRPRRTQASKLIAARRI
jgi:hypothetical protein